MSDEAKKSKGKKKESVEDWLAARLAAALPDDDDDEPTTVTSRAALFGRAAQFRSGPGQEKPPPKQAPPPKRRKTPLAEPRDPSFYEVRQAEAATALPSPRAPFTEVRAEPASEDDEDIERLPSEELEPLHTEDAPIPAHAADSEVDDLGPTELMSAVTDAALTAAGLPSPDQDSEQEPSDQPDEWDLFGETGGPRPAVAVPPRSRASLAVTVPPTSEPSPVLEPDPEAEPAPMPKPEAPPEPVGGPSGDLEAAPDEPEFTADLHEFTGDLHGPEDPTGEALLPTSAGPATEEAASETAFLEAPTEPDAPAQPAASALEPSALAEPSSQRKKGAPTVSTVAAPVRARKSDGKQMDDLIAEVEARHAAGQRPSDVETAPPAPRRKPRDEVSRFEGAGGFDEVFPGDTLEEKPPAKLPPPAKPGASPVRGLNVKAIRPPRDQLPAVANGADDSHLPGFEPEEVATEDGTAWERADPKPPGLSLREASDPGKGGAKPLSSDEVATVRQFPAVDDFTPPPQPLADVDIPDELSRTVRTWVTILVGVAVFLLFVLLFGIVVVSFLFT